jgi:hypothetical protein
MGTETEHDGKDLGAIERPFAFTREIPGALNLFPAPFAGIDGAQNDFDQPSKKSFALELGPKLLELRGSYWERRREDPVQLDGLSPPGETRWGRYYDLLATSSQFDGKLVGEAEAAYSTLGFSTLNDQEPVMTRLGVHGRWGKTGYGLSYRTSGRGFVAPTGAAIEHDRDESQIWVEYDFGVFRMRGAAGEMWEKNFITKDLTLTRSAATSFYVNKANWSATLSATYSLMGQSEDTIQKGIGFTNGFSLAYRPTPLLTLEPNLAYKQEWAPITRLKTDIPSAGFALTYKQSRDLQLIGRTSYTRELSEDPLRDASLVNAAAGLNWNLGQSFLGRQSSLSFQLEYKNELRASLPRDLQSNLTGSVQFKVLGF